MIYIKKEGLSDEINRKIIEIRKSDKWNDIGCLLARIRIER
jgi:hypothetical protein